jgi:glyoxylase-like metal-dependent hydrolase (beta-lactamase superfamily II)
MRHRPPRAFRLAALACALALVPATTAARAAGTESGAGKLTELAPGVELLRGAFVPGSQPDGNSVVFRGPAGLAVVDTGRHPAHTRRLLDHAAAAGQPIVAILNTHWHLDHVGGNVLLRREHPSAKVHASDAIRGALAEGGFLASYRAQLETMIADPKGTEESRAPLRAELGLLAAAPALAPDVVVAASGPLELAGRAFDVRLERATTQGDLWVLDRTSGILVAGDLVTLPAPFLDTACPRRWQEALGRLAAAEWRTLVPGHGAPMDRAAFARWRGAFDSLLACGAGERPAAECVEGWIRDAGDLVEPGHEGLVRGMGEYYVTNHLRNAEKTAQLCGG